MYYMITVPSRPHIPAVYFIPMHEIQLKQIWYGMIKSNIVAIADYVNIENK